MKKEFDNKMWRFLSMFWGVLYLFVICADFVYGNMYDRVIGPLGTVYIATLTMFVGSKEFDRWHERHPGKKHGERFVFVFTAIIFIMFAVSFSKNGSYEVSPDILAAYIAVLSIFVISEKSKELYGERIRKSEEKKYEDPNTES